MSQLHEIVSDSLTIEAEGCRRIIIKAVWIPLVSDIIPECNNVIPISTDQLGKWMPPSNQPEVKVRRGQRYDYEHRDVLPRSGKQRVHMLGAKLRLIATRLLLSMFSALLPRVASMAFAVAVLRKPMCLEWKGADANKHNRTYGLLICAPLCGPPMSPQPRDWHNQIYRIVVSPAKLNFGFWTAAGTSDLPGQREPFSPKAYRLRPDY